MVTSVKKGNLTPSMRIVAEVMADGEWYSLADICSILGTRNWGSVASRIRDLKATGRFNYNIRPTNERGVNQYQLYEVDKGQLEFWNMGLDTTSGKT